MQIGFHDGRSTISDTKSKRIGDTCIIQIPDQKILEIIKLEAGCSGISNTGELTQDK